MASRKLCSPSELSMARFANSCGKPTACLGVGKLAHRQILDLGPFHGCETLSKTFRLLMFSAGSTTPERCHTMVVVCVEVVWHLGQLNAQRGIQNGRIPVPVMPFDVNLGGCVTNGPPISLRRLEE